MSDSIKPIRTLIKLQYIARRGAHCEVCLTEKGTVMVGSVNIRWWPHDPGLADREIQRRCFLCIQCQEPDGGIVSLWSVNGAIVVLTSGRSKVPNRIIVLPAPPFQLQ